MSLSIDFTLDIVCAEIRYRSYWDSGPSTEFSDGGVLRWKQNEKVNMKRKRTADGACYVWFGVRDELTFLIVINPCSTLWELKIWSTQL